MNNKRINLSINVSIDKLYTKNSTTSEKSASPAHTAEWLKI